jgi:hypothetical protein
LSDDDGAKIGELIGKRKRGNFRLGIYKDDSGLESKDEGNKGEHSSKRIQGPI